MDIAANLTEDSFLRGEYNGKKYHEPDFNTVIDRGHRYGVKKYLFTATHFEDAVEAFKAAKRSRDFFCTIGVHPCRATECYKDEGGPNIYFGMLENFLRYCGNRRKFMAIGECGLDYDRLQYASKE
jgi:TatD DNase family protein